jgi:TRAP transporter TAXI family solute receptor
MKEFRSGVLGGLLAAGMMLALPTGGAEAANRFVAIGTGGPTGVYFVVGNAICRMIHKEAEKSGGSLKCSAPASGGSIYNINAIRTKDLDMGVAQSDWQQHAYKGTSKFEGQKFDKLRAMFSVYPEPFQIIVGKDSGINRWDDLKGKRVNIGNPDSGQRGTFEELMAAYGIDGSFFGQVSELTSTEQTGALCDGKIDAFGYTVGVPNAGVAQATDGCGARIIALDGPVIDKLVADNAFYVKVTIPKGTYASTTADVPTFGAIATIVTSADEDEDTVYQVVKAVFENIDEFRRLHPAFANLDPQKMIKDGIQAPLHPGAIKYYREKGWMK